MSEARKVTVEMRDEHRQLVGTLMEAIEAHGIDPVARS
jgi:hypothetical protein